MSGLSEEEQPLRSQRRQDDSVRVSSGRDATVAFAAPAHFGTHAHFVLGGCCSAAGTMLGSPPVAAGCSAVGMATGMFCCPLALATLSTPVGPPGMHLSPVNVCSQCSVARHWLRQGITSHNPVFGLQAVPVVHIAMHPPAARSAAADPRASAVMVLAPANVFGEPVWQPAKPAPQRRSANSRPLHDLMFPS